MSKVCRYFDIKKDASGRDVMEVYVDGIALLRLVLTNKGTAFTEEERRNLGLDGLLPPRVNDLNEQVDRVFVGYKRQPTAIDKYQFLRQLQDRQEILYYAVVERYLTEMLPIVYTPTVGQAVREFSALYQNARGLSLSPLNIDRAKEAFQTYPMQDVRMIVATDSSAILGIGDQGYGGLAIPIGKLTLYTVAGGVSPFHTMPVALDVGTERQDLTDDRFYLGVRQRRLTGEAYYAFVDKFVEGVLAHCPRAVIQWEDLSKEQAHTVLERYRDRVSSFNDDIQGTGAVTLAGVLSACRMKGERLKDQTVVIHGAGAGGIGVAWAIREGLVRDGLTDEQASERVLVLDSKGLLVHSRDMEAYKRPFAQPHERVQGWRVKGAYPSLAETVEHSRATVLLGLSGTPGAFDEATVVAMAKNTEQPIIFPLSNPTSSSEATPADLVKWTDGQAIVATGSPFDPVLHKGRTILTGQGNNAFIFPGLGFGATLCEASKITDAMVLEAAYALDRYTKEKHGDNRMCYPPVSAIQESSVRVAAAVIAQAQRDGVARKAGLPADLESYVASRFWKPAYLPVVRG